MKTPAAIKTVGSSGQISLGKQHAGRTVTVEEVEHGVWLIKTARVIPDNELWLHSPSTGDRLSRAIRWAEKNPPVESDLDKVEKKFTRRK